MFSSTETSFQSKKRRWPKYVGFLLLAPLLLVSALCALGFVHLVPPISAEVVDAVTNKPVSGMSVCLQVESMNLGGLQGRRNSMLKTGNSGRFFFWPSVHGDILPAWRGDWIRITDPNTEIASPCGPDIGQWDLTMTHGWPISLGPNANGGSRYFPLALLRGQRDRYFYGWEPMYRAMGFPVGSRIALIPVLQSVSDCKKIPDPSLAENCRQLNTYATALSLRRKDDPDSWALAETLCREVTDNAYSAMCEGNFYRVTRSRQARQSNRGYSAAHDPFANE
jgi:hypothetical protein